MPRSSYLFPFALNASPNGVSLPPPAAFSWHCPQAFPVCVANAAVAFAGPDVVKDVVATMKIMAAVPQTKTNALLAFNFMVVSPLSVAARLSRRRLSNARRFHAIAYVSYGRCREELCLCRPAHECASLQRRHFCLRHRRDPRKRIQSLRFRQGVHYLYCDTALSRAFFIDAQAASTPDCMSCHADSLAVRISCNFE